MKSYNHIIALKGLKEKADEIIAQEVGNNSVDIKDISNFYTGLNFVYTEYFNNYCNELKATFLSGQDGLLHNKLYARMVDRLFIIFIKNIEKIYKDADMSNFAIIAVGGYGRGGLAPHSDIDILFLTKRKVSQAQNRMIDFILYHLWGLNLKVGHACRTIKESMKYAHDDQTILTNLLENRLLAGDRKLYQTFTQKLHKNCLLGHEKKFITAKLDEANTRHKRMGNTRYMLEPNVKEGKGGLRDLHLIQWIMLGFYKTNNIDDLKDMKIFSPNDIKKYHKARQFFSTLRTHLHYLCNRGQNNLTFDRQSELATAMGYKDRPTMLGVERLMRHYFLHANKTSELRRIIVTDYNNKTIYRQQQKQKKKIDNFIIIADCLSLEDANLFKQNPMQMMRFFKIAAQHDLNIHPAAFKAIANNIPDLRILRKMPEAYSIFLDILTAPSGQERLLRMMSESGFLGAFLPDFGRIIAQMQYDMYHVYTTDEHTIRAIGNVNKLVQKISAEQHPVACKEVQKIASLKILYMATFLHDITKGRKGDHSTTGAELALKLCPKFSFTPQECETVSWLVRHHLLMSNTAFKRDLDDPKTIENFVETVSTPEKLRLLLCLTVADITAVGPSVWNNWKAHLIRTLFHRALAHLSGDGASEDSILTDAMNVKHGLSEKLSSLPEPARHHFLSSAPLSYYLAYNMDDLVYHATFIHNYLTGPQQKSGIAIDMRVQPENSVVKMLVYTKNTKGLMAKLAGGISLSYFSVVSARINTFSDGMALDSFILQAPLQQQNIYEKDLQKLGDYITLAVQEKISIEQELRSRKKRQDKHRNVFKVTPHVDINNNASNSFTLIEVTAKDRLGLMFDISNILADMKLHIGFSRITTFGEEAVDVFYVRDEYGLPITHKDRIAIIKERLLNAVIDG